MFSKLLCVYLVVSFSSQAFCQFTIDMDQFNAGDYWVWSYSEKKSEQSTGEGAYKKPYIYEKYEVVERLGSLVTIEMSSSSDPDLFGAAHHKFIADVSECLLVGSENKPKELKKWKIEFYSKSIGSGWSLVGKNFKSLAFTEKFNCISEPVIEPYKELELNGETLTLYQNYLGRDRSWYASGP